MPLDKTQQSGLSEIEKDTHKLIEQIMEKMTMTAPWASGTKGWLPGDDEVLVLRGNLVSYTDILALKDLDKSQTVTITLARNTPLSSQATIHFNESMAIHEEIVRLGNKILEQGVEEYKVITNSLKTAGNTLNETFATARKRADELDILADMISAFGRIVAVV